MRVQVHSGKGLRLTGSPLVDGFFREEGLLADAVGDFGEFALVGADGGEVVGPADEVEGAESFPDLFVARSHGGDLGIGGYEGTRGYGKGSNAAADGRPKFGGGRVGRGAASFA
jgi:hypothetical protein